MSNQEAILVQYTILHTLLVALGDESVGKHKFTLKPLDFFNVVNPGRALAHQGSCQTPKGWLTFDIDGLCNSYEEAGYTDYTDAIRHTCSTLEGLFQEADAVQAFGELSAVREY